MTSTQLLIGDEWVDASSGATAETINPANGETMADGGTADAEAAVAELLDENATEIAALENLDQGQPTFITSGVSLPLAAQVFRYHAGYATKIEGGISPVSREPTGPDRPCLAVGGLGLSGWGRELGSYSIEECTETRTTFINLA